MSVWVFDLDGTLVSTNNDYAFPVLEFVGLVLRTFDYRAPHYSTILKLFGDIEKTNFKEMRAHRDRFPKSMVDTYLELCRQSSTSADLDLVSQCRGIGKSALSEDLYRGRTLIPGAQDALEFLQKQKARLYCVTAGDYVVQMWKYSGYSLLKSFFPSEKEFIVVEWDKTEALRKIRNQFPTEQVFMVGDSVGSDLWPASNAGVTPVYIPAPSVWDHGELKEDLPSQTHHLVSIRAIPFLYENLFGAG